MYKIYAKFAEVEIAKVSFNYKFGKNKLANLQTYHNNFFAH